jgi:L-ascorbate metabolism protein UlaG (beta-lactamase superfamily)
MGAGNLHVTWLGHGTVLVELDGARLLLDPVLRARVGPLRNHAPLVAAPTVDAALVSHVHRDHLDLPSLALLAPTRVVLTRGAARWLDDRHEVTEVTVGGRVRVGDVAVTAFPAAHTARRNRVGPLVESIGFVLEGSRRVYLAGDTSTFPEMARLGDGRLDLAVLPVGGWGLTLGPGHMDAVQAAAALTLLRPRVAVPVHWGTLRLPLLWRLRPDLYLLPGQQFGVAARRSAPDVDVRVLVPGERVTLAGPAVGATDLPPG